MVLLYLVDKRGFIFTIIHLRETVSQVIVKRKVELNVEYSE